MRNVENIFELLTFYESLLKGGEFKVTGRECGWGARGGIHQKGHEVDVCLVHEY